MALADFIHLRVHTAYSLSEGAIHIKTIADLCKRYRMPAVAMTDSDNLFGALEFSQTLWSAGIQPLIGVTLSMANPLLAADPRGRAPDPDRLVLLVQNEVGYRNLIKLVSRAHLEGDGTGRPQIEFGWLEGCTDGLIALTGGPGGPVGRNLLSGDGERARRMLEMLAEAFPGRLYIEIQRHELEEENRTEDAFLELAYSHDIPLVATNQAFFPDRDMYEAHDTLLCIAEGKYVEQDDRRKLTPEHGFKSSDEMTRLFADLPEAVRNTRVIAERCAFRLRPIEPILPNFAAGTELSEEELLRKDATAGLEARLRTHVFDDTDDEETRQRKARPYLERLDHELAIISTMGFPGYFLIVADFIQWAKDHDIPVGPGRGSGAGSVVAWALRITDLDPLRFDLLFERFLNPDRVSMPDFDIDFCQDKREQVIRYVQDKYGHDQVAQIITFGKLQARAVLRDVGRVMQQPFPVTDRLCKLVPNNPASPTTLAEAIAEEPRLQYERDNDGLTAEVISRSLKLEGLYRHASTHAAGVVIGDRPLDELIPLYRDPRSDMPVTQFNMNWVEQTGLVKFDFLGLKTLTVLDRALAYIRDRDIEVSLETIPLDDNATFELLGRGESSGVFQLEGSGMQSTLKGLKPDKFEDIIALVALYRPGPMDNIPTYISRKHGREEIEYPHPMLEDILSETYGVIIYQEQVMQIAQVMADYSLGEADLLRRAMGKKKVKEMDAQRARFVSGAKNKGVDEARATYIFDLVAKFAGYGFNKSHAAAYALVAYQTAYMKANFPVEFMAATMTLDINNTDKLAIFRKELVRQGIPLLSPDINYSDSVFAVEKISDSEQSEEDAKAGRAVRYALGGIKGVGTKAMCSVVEERRRHGLFESIWDFADRVDVHLINRRQLEQLAAAGAFDSLDDNRARVTEAIDAILRRAHAAAEARESRQESLFGGDGDSPIEETPRLTANPWPEHVRLAREQAAIGFYLSGHPLGSYAGILAHHNVQPSTEITPESDLIGRTVKLAGTIESYREGKSRQSGKKYAFLGLSDGSGEFEVMIFSDLLDRARALVEKGGPIVVSTDIRTGKEKGTLRLTAQGLESLDELAERTAMGLQIHVRDAAPFEDIDRVLSGTAEGRGRVEIVLPVDGDCAAVLELEGRHAISPPLLAELKALPGVVRVHEH